MGYEFTLHLGWWIFPLIISLTICVVAWTCGDHEPAIGYGNIGKGLGNLIVALIALVCILLTWLIYALLT